ncbi:hypothetical protein Tco_1016638, partial [Tanacetum coccineum]
LLLSDDERIEESDDDVFEAGDEMDEDIHQADEEETQSPKPSKESSTKIPTEEPISQEHQSHTPHKDHRKDHWEKHEEAAASYADLKWSLKDFIHTSFNKYENNDIDLRNFQQLITLFKTDHNTSMRKILKNLKGVHDVVKEDPALNKKVLNAAEAYIKNSSNLTKLPSLAKSSTSMALTLGPRITNIKFTQAAIQSDISSLKQDTSEIKSMMTEIFNAFKGQYSFAPLSSMPTTTLAITEGPTTVRGGDVTSTATEEPPSHTEGENVDIETKKEKTVMRKLIKNKSLQEQLEQFQSQLSDH